MCLRPRPPPAVVSFVACSFSLVVDFSKSLPAKQNVIKPPPHPTPPKEQAEQITENGKDRKTQKAPSGESQKTWFPEVTNTPRRPRFSSFGPSRNQKSPTE